MHIFKRIRPPPPCGVDWAGKRGGEGGGEGGRRWQKAVKLDLTKWIPSPPPSVVGWVGKDGVEREWIGGGEVGEGGRRGRGGAQ